VKAPVALGDTTSAVTYAPYDSDEARSRIRQQVSLGAGPTTFEPRDAANASIIQNVATTNQLSLLKTATGTVGAAALRQNYRSWSPNNFNVLADTTGTGLKRDLSIEPSLLGVSAQAWLDYTTYMESPDASAISAFPPIPTITPESIRRRYVMQPSGTNSGLAPVLSYFGLSFSFRNDSSDSFLEVASRCVVGLWNPYTAALVPEDLELVITAGLPDVLVQDSLGVGQMVQLQTILGSGTGLKFSLPFTSNSTDADRSSWLPGRVYNWSALSGTGQSGTTGNPMLFYVRDSNPLTGAGVVWPVGSPLTATSTAVPVTRQCFIATPTTLTIELRRASDGVKLAEFKSVQFDDIPGGTNPIETNASSFDFALIFRLPDRAEQTLVDSPTWLQAPGRDPRESSFPTDGYLVPGGNGNKAEQFGGPGVSQFAATFPNLLLDRSPGEKGFDQDAPVFELPRGPLLSLGALQHLALPSARPFSVGNSWGATADINGTPAAQLFDRFFFSGLTPTVTPSTEGNALVLPNPLLRVTPRSVTGTPTTVDDLRTAPTARSSKFLLQGGAFNVNSTNVAAWAAVLRSVRFPAAAFNYLDADDATGTAAETGETPATVQSGDAQFFRFSQSAQETYKAESGLAAGAGNTSAANTHLFRQGMITLDADKVTALAAQIVALVRARNAPGGPGPFRSLAEFLSPSADTLDATGGQISLLEKAIADAAINVDSDGNPIEFSSQFLTQGDIMTALAPVLFPRSDTFVIRTYGEAVNPATGATEGKAWCEATVQRIPEYFDPADDATVAPADLKSALNQNLGRRFKVVSFRWLTRSDI
jgi:hypothetical protein